VTAPSREDFLKSGAARIVVAGPLGGNVDSSRRAPQDHRRHYRLRMASIRSETASANIPVVALIGTRDTKGDELAWIRRRIEEHQCRVLSIDPGTFSDGGADVGAAEIAKRADSDLDSLRHGGDRGTAIEVLSRGTRAVICELVEQGVIHGILAVGGSGGSSVAAPALQAVPIGFPKLLLSTMTSGDVRPYVGASDVTMTYSVVDVSGLNSVSELILDNAAAAIAGMAHTYVARQTQSRPHDARPLVTMTMFGVTTPAADEARARLEQHGYEVLVFHATGSGGRAMEKLIASGLVAGVCDLTTTELCDNLVGGILSAGPDRLRAASLCGVPQVVSVGAVDMVNFGPRDSVPSQYSKRTLLQHNPSITLMRTTADEMSAIGKEVASKVAMAHAPTSVFLPLGGVSSVDVPGQPFFDPEADTALFDAIRQGLSGTHVEIQELPMAINDPGFGRAMADRLHDMIQVTVAS